MLHLRLHLKFHFRKHLKMHKNVKKKHAFHAAADDPLDSAIKGCA